MKLFGLFFLSTLLSLLAVKVQNFKKITLNYRKAQLKSQRSLESFLAIAKASNAFDLTVSVDFGAAYREQHGIDASDSDIYMQILISTSQSGLSAPNSSCLDFIDQTYYCEPPLCTENTSSPQTFISPFYSIANATTLNINESSTISFADGAWKLNTPPLYTRNCQFTIEYDFAYGWIGLGTSGDSNSNFQTPNPVFSLYFLPKLGSAEIIFGVNTSYINNTDSIVTLVTDSDWKLTVSSLSFGSISSNFTEDIPLIFDVTVTKIYLPATQYNATISYLLSLPTSACETSEETDYNQGSDFSIIYLCPFNNDLSILPTLTFNLANGAEFSLPPNSYLSEVDGSYKLSYSVEFAPYDTTITNQNYTIMGTNVLFSYYSVFSQSDSGVNTITLYPLFGQTNSANSTLDTPNNHNATNNTSQNSSSSSHKVIIIVVSVVVFLVLCVGIGFLGYKRGWWLTKKSMGTEEPNLGLELKRGINESSVEEVVHSESSAT